MTCERLYCKFHYEISKFTNNNAITSEKLLQQRSYHKSLFATVAKLMDLTASYQNQICKFCNSCGALCSAEPL